MSRILLSAVKGGLLHFSLLFSGCLHTIFGAPWRGEASFPSLPSPLQYGLPFCASVSAFPILRTSVLLGCGSALLTSSSFDRRPRPYYRSSFIFSGDAAQTVAASLKFCSVKLEGASRIVNGRFRITSGHTPNDTHCLWHKGSH